MHKKVSPIPTSKYTTDPLKTLTISLFWPKYLPKWPKSVNPTPRRKVLDQTKYGWMPHNASFDFLDIARAALGQIHFWDRFWAPQLMERPPCLWNKSESKYFGFYEVNSNWPRGTGSQRHSTAKIISKNSWKWSSWRVLQLLPKKVSPIPTLKYTTDPLKTLTIALFWP
jgi:hypothetical protein